MVPTIFPATTNDLPMIFHLLEEAIEFQRQHKYRGWDSYDQLFIARDVENRSVFKMQNDEDTVAIFSIYTSDRLIWRERDKGNALYLHRIVLNQRFKGAKVFGHILNWAIERAQQHGLSYVRMDTWADNSKLIDYYTSYGFKFVENYTTSDTTELPLQHRNLELALLELTLGDQPVKEKYAME
jgi:ribosomal protein S18 acetylase RimI-like enzyme